MTDLNLEAIPQWEKELKENSPWLKLADGESIEVKLMEVAESVSKMYGTKQIDMLLLPKGKTEPKSFSRPHPSINQATLKLLKDIKAIGATKPDGYFTLTHTGAGKASRYIVT